MHYNDVCHHDAHYKHLMQAMLGLGHHKGYYKIKSNCMSVPDSPL